MFPQSKPLTEDIRAEDPGQKLDIDHNVLLIIQRGFERGIFRRVSGVDWIVKATQPCHGRRWDWQLIQTSMIAVFVFLGLSEQSSRRGNPGACLVVIDMRPGGNEDGSKSSYRQHGYGNAGFYLLPHENPSDVGLTAIIDTGNSSDGRNDHANAETEKSS